MKSTQEKNLMFEVEGNMNKLMGFYELTSMNIPSIPWKEYTGKEIFLSTILWTIRSAVFQGDDLNLPRAVGVTSDRAKEFANELLEKLDNKGIVIFYPYFLANKSGTLNVYKDSVIIEGVKKDLWNLVTFSDRDITIQIEKDKEIVHGDAQFLSDKEKNELLSYIAEIRRIFREDLIEGNSILLEWSFAQNCDINKIPIGEEYLVFYEARTV